jgi:hypothetical protein
MADEIDQTDIREQFYLAIQIANAANGNIDINGTGCCIVCKEPTEPVVSFGKVIIPRWCSVDCRDGLSYH